MSQTHSKLVVLLLSQSQQTRRSISKILEPNFIVFSAEDAESAWEQLVGNPEILILVSELTLTIDEFNLLERIRNANENRLAATPVLLLVGENDEDDDRETAFGGGATDFINMPFVSNELITRVRLHVHLFMQQVDGHAIDTESVVAANVLQQLAQEHIFLSRLEQELSFSCRHKTFVSVCKLKVDNLKSIVASFDKKTAGIVVQTVAKILLQSIRREDTLCYLGRGEFCIIFPATNGIGVAVCVERVQKKMLTCNIRARDLRVPASLSGAIYTGIAESHDNTETVLNILQTRLKQAIAKGGNHIISSARNSEKARMSVDQALRFIEGNNTGPLQPVARDLMRDIIPLLEYSDSVLNLGMRSVNKILREKLK